MIERLLAMAARRPRAPLVLHEDATWDFATVALFARRGANWLEQLGVGRGDRVLVAVGNRPLFLFYWFALAARGAVAVPVAPESFGESLRYVARQSEARLVLSEQSECERIAAELASMRVIAFADEAAFAAAVATCAATDVRPAQAGDAVSILYTSGTTGLPKGAVIPNRSYTAIGEKMVEAIGITPEDRILTFLPLHHANPQMYAVLSALTTGCAIALLPRFSASGFLEQVRRYRATGFTYVGTVLTILARTVSSPSPSTLRWCTGGGAPRAVWEQLAPMLGVRVHELYGMTETGGMVTINTREHERLGSVGRPRDDFEVGVVDDADECVPTGRVGEIVVRPRAPHVMTSGYYNKPQETLDAVRNLWFHTGDLGRFDADGYLYFEGRSKELIRRAGEMISPVEIEIAALKHPQVADCAAVGVPDEIVEEEIKLVVVPRAEAQAEDIAEFLRARLARHKVPRYVEFAEAIPKTPTQKIQRFKLKTLSPACVDLRAVPTAG